MAVDTRSDLHIYLQCFKDVNGCSVRSVLHYTHSVANEAVSGFNVSKPKNIPTLTKWMRHFHIFFCCIDVTVPSP